MYSNFIKNSKIETIYYEEKFYLYDNEMLNLLFSECGGKSVNNGLYKICTSKLSLHWSKILVNYFTQFNDKLVVFGFDWLGRIYALDKNRFKCILMFDPANLNFYELEQDLVSFHNHDLVYDSESIFDLGLFKEVISKFKVSKLEYQKCFGYKQSLFLGGLDIVDNYEIIDLEVYWEMQYQIFSSIR